MASKIEVKNRSIIIRPVNTPIIQEDLVTFSNLIIRPQVRSTILQTSNGTQTGSFNSTRILNFLKPNKDKKFFTSDWTDDEGKEENFGIDSIDLTFDSNYIPRVNINFKDVRGKALFDNTDLTNSPFVHFLSLPYPLFELELKGYYGKATSMLLSLLKFNTKFNSSTGNFESVGNFVGLNFGFLSDIPIYLGLAAPYMFIDSTINGEAILAEIYKEQFPNDNNGLDVFKNINAGDKFFTFLDLIRISKNLNVLLTTSVSPGERETLQNIVQTILDLADVRREIGSINDNEEIKVIIDERKLAGTDEDRLKFSEAVDRVFVLDGEVNQNKTALTLAIDNLIVEYEKKRDELKDDLFTNINQEIINTFRINFTIENVFRIVINSFEVFFRMLNKISEKSAENRKNNPIQRQTTQQSFDGFLNFEKQFPWPKWVNQTQNGVELALPDPVMYPYEKKFIDAFIEASINTINIIQAEATDLNNTPQSFDWNPTTQQTFNYEIEDISALTSEKIAKIVYGSLFGLTQIFDNIENNNGIREDFFSKIATTAGRLDIDNIYRTLTTKKELVRFDNSIFNDMPTFNEAYNRFLDKVNFSFNSSDKEIFYIDKNSIKDFIISDVESFNQYKQLFDENVFNITNLKDVYTFSFEGGVKNFINILVNSGSEVKYALDYNLKINYLHFYINQYFNPNTTFGQKSAILEKIKITFYSLFFTETAKQFIEKNPKIGGFVNINRLDATLIYANAAFYEICLKEDNIGFDRSALTTNRNLVVLNSDNIPYSSRETILFSGDTFNSTINKFIADIEPIVREIITEYVGEINLQADLTEFSAQQEIIKNNLAKIEKNATNIEYIYSFLLVNSDTREEFFDKFTSQKGFSFNNFTYNILSNSIRLKQIPAPVLATGDLVAIPTELDFRATRYFEYKNSFDKIDFIDPIDLLLINIEKLLDNRRGRLKELLNIIIKPISRPGRNTDANDYYNEFLIETAVNTDKPKTNTETDIYYTAVVQNQQDFLQKTTLNNYFAGFRKRLEELKIEQPIQNRTELDKLKLVVESDDIRLSLYLMFKNIHDKWFYYSGDGKFVFRLKPNNLADTQQNRANNTLFDLFSFVDRGNRPIGDQAVIDITFFNTYLSSGSAIKNSLYSLISELLGGSKGANQWNFYVLPSYFNFGGIGQNSARTLEDVYQSLFGQYTTVEKELSSSPKFLCQYIGGVSSQLDINSENFSNDAATDKFFDETGANITVFEVDFGNQDQGIFKSIQLDQAEYRETAESLVVIDRLAQTDGSANIQAQSGNLFNVYSNRSYTAKIEMAGNMMILPTMYFKLNNIPMYSGYYLITKVNHTITQGSFSTSIEGVRIPLYRLPIVTELITFVKRQLLDTILETTPTNSDGTTTSAEVPPTSTFSNSNPQISKYGLITQNGETYDAKRFIAALIIAEGSGNNDANNKAIMASLYNRSKEDFRRTPTHEQILANMAKQIIKSGQYEPWKKSGFSVINLLKKHLTDERIVNRVLALLTTFEQGYDKNIFEVQEFPNYVVKIDPVPATANDNTWNFDATNFTKQTFNVADAYYFIGLKSQKTAGRGLTDTFFNAFKVGNFSTESNPRAIAAIRSNKTDGLLQVYFTKT